MWSNKFLLYVSLILLTACRPVKNKDVDVVDPEIIRVTYSPTLSWLEPALNRCTLLNPALGLVTEIGYDPVESTKGTDVLITMGEDDYKGKQPILLGFDEVIIISHQDNPTRSLTKAQIQQIFTGQVTDWDLLNSDFSGIEINPWSYPRGSDLLIIFENELELNRLNPQTTIAPHPQALQQAISVDPGAIGLITRRWLDGIVNEITIEGLDQSSLTQPILASSSEDPSVNVKNWLFCLQQSIQEKPAN